MNNIQLIDLLYRDNYLPREDLLSLLNSLDKDESDYLYKMASKTKEEYYGKSIFLRGLIEISSYCKQACKYCGINRNNKEASRYRLTKDEILGACRHGYGLGFRTFVLQGGEDEYFTDDLVVGIIQDIKMEFPEVAVTLSLGEKTKESYEKFFLAGADRYLLRHETCNEKLYGSIHENLDLKDRLRCLRDLKEIGYQVGAGFMIGIPTSRIEDIVDDILFLKEINPDMVGMGPFIPHSRTIYRDEPHGDLEISLRALALVRLFLPRVLLPATTALNSIYKNGRKYGFRSGCNVIMPNLSPISNRSKYSLYENKAYSGNESAEELRRIGMELKDLGLRMDMSRGDRIDWEKR